MVSLSESKELLLWCHSRVITLSARHILGKLNLVADSLSWVHSVLHTEWTLCSQAFHLVWDLCFTPVVDFSNSV